MGNSRRRAKKTFFDGPFCGRTREMLESPAYRVLSRAALLVMARLEVALSHAGGSDANGKFHCTYQRLADYGVHKDAIGPAIRELVALGFAVIEHRGAGGNAEFRDPTLYRLTFLPTEFAAPTHQWRSHETAKSVAKAARSSPDRAAVERGKKTEFRPRFSDRIAPGFRGRKSTPTAPGNRG